MPPHIPVNVGNVVFHPQTADEPVHTTFIIQYNAPFVYGLLSREFSGIQGMSEHYQQIPFIIFSNVHKDQMIFY